MLLIVKIILVTVLVGLAVVLIAVWWFLNRVKTIFKDALSGTRSVPPCRVTLQPESHPGWRSAEKIAQYTKDFEANGFSSLGAFRIPELRGLLVAAFVNEAQSLFGVVYDHEKLPPNFDVVCRYEDDTDLTVTSTTYARGMDRRSESPIIRLDGMDVRQAVDAAWKHPASAPRLPAKGADFVSRFESSYAREMNWRMSRGGVTREEVRRRAEKDGGKISEERLDAVYGRLRSAHMKQLQAANITQYKTDQKIAPAEWEKIARRVFVIPVVFTEAEARAEIEGNLTLDEKTSAALRQIKLAPGQTALDFTNQVLAGKAGQLPLRRIGSVKEPAPAELFLREPADDAAEKPL